jgi:hypothetical protein
MRHKLHRAQSKRRVADAALAFQTTDDAASA